MSEKIKLLAGIIVIIAAVATIGLYAFGAAPIELPEIVLIALVLSIIAGAVLIIWPRFKAMRAGLPAEDERLKSVSHKAGYYAFIGAIWGCLAIMMLFPEVGDSDIARHALEGVILLTGIVFVVSYLWLNRKGNVD
ncbi:MAG: DUF2178 domain-containing protein [Candidatus Diapherotrites archaeon]|nr:DUF2178 domain-containing protein [Candidatus Micrarchaeota archaeon]